MKPAAFILTVTAGILLLYAARDLPARHVLEDDDLAYQRPGNGLMPYEKDRIIGRRTKTAISAHGQITLEHLEDDKDQ